MSEVQPPFEQIKTFSLSVEGVNVIFDDLLSKFDYVESIYPTSEEAATSILGRGMDNVAERKARLAMIGRIAGVLDYIIPLDGSRTWQEEIEWRRGQSYFDPTQRHKKYEPSSNP